MSEPDRTRLPIRRPPFQGVANRTLAGSAARLEPDRAKSAARRGPERPAGADRRRRVRQPGTFGGPIDDTELHADCRGRPEVQPVPRDGAVLPHPGGAADRAQPPHRRHGSVGEFAGGVSRLLGHPPAGFRAAAPDPCGGTGTARRLRQGHLTPDDQQGPAGPFDRWPNGWGSTILGLPGRRGEPVGPSWQRTRRSSGRDRSTATQENPYYLPDAMAEQDDRVAARRPAQDAHKPWFAYFSTGMQPRSPPRAKGVG